MELNDAEKIMCGKAFNTFADVEAANNGTVAEFRAFSAGFAAGLDYRQEQINDLLAVLAEFIKIGPGASWIIDYYGHDADTVDKLDKLIEIARAAIAKVEGQ